MRERLYRGRILLLLIGVLALMSAISPTFATQANAAAILKGASTNLYAAIGFTIVMIAGQLDLSVGAIMTLGAMLTIGLAPTIGWLAAVAVAVSCGALVGLGNGWLVARARVNAFIVTLGTMTMLGGASNLFSGGSTLFVSDFSVADRLDPAGSIVTPRVLMSIAALVIAAIALQFTTWGRGIYLIGGSAQTARFAGLSVTRNVIGAFVLSGALSAFGGAMFAISVSSANPTMGDRSLMPIVAATIIGGTSMAGGRGSVLGTATALVALVALINGLGTLGAGFEAQQLASGGVLALVVAYDAWRARVADRARGQRPELMAEWGNRARAEDEMSTTSRGPTDRTFALACVAIVGCVSVVAIFALMRQPSMVGPAPMDGAKPQAASVDWSSLKASDGQPLLALADVAPAPPPRPADPAALAEDDALHWYDREFAGANTKRVNVPTSKGDGARGKRVMLLRFMDHPYLTAYERGARQVADVVGIEMKSLVANNDINIQSQHVDQAINERPDLVIIMPVDATAVVPLLRKLNQAGVPVIVSNLLPIEDGLPYALCWTGPDDWGQFRMLAKEFAARMNYEGGYCVVRHMPGASAFFARTYAMVTELKKIAPKMHCLDMQPTGLEAERTMQQTADWLTRHGPLLKGIVSADDSGAQIGIDKACANANRGDVVRVAAGNSKVGMDAVAAGTLVAITYQSPEADGALPMKLAADFFDGKSIDRTVYYLPKKIITKANVAEFLPPQW